MIRKKKDLRLENLQIKVKNNLNKLCDFNKDIKLIKVDTNSCFDFNKAKLSIYNDFIPIIDNSNDDIPKYKSIIVNMVVDETQSCILQKWFNSYIDMYNEVIKHYIKNYIYDDVRNLKIIYDENKDLFLDTMKTKNDLSLLLKQKRKLNSDYNKTLKNKNKKKKKKNNDNEIIDSNKTKLNELTEEIIDIKNKIKKLNIILDVKKKEYNKSLYVKKKETNKLMTKLNYKNLRTYHLKDIRNHIQAKSSDDDKFKIRIHILDCAIKLACVSYKTCVSNFLNNKIKKFKIKYWRKNKKNKVMELEKSFIKKNELLKDVFGSLKLSYNEEEYKLTGDETVTILYCSSIKKYYLLVSKKIEQTETKSKKYIAIDPGIKPFISCRTNDELINVGTNMSSLIGKYIKKIDILNDIETMTKKQKNKKERKYYLKLKNITDELHWKIIKYITNNYGNVIIGNLSMKEASKKEKSKLNSELKRIGLMLRISEFRRRLRYKCLINGIKIEVINEAYTSKVCSTCGNCKHELKGEKDYECVKCNTIKNRDFNSATNMILLKM